MTGRTPQCRIIHAPSAEEPFVVLENPTGLPTAPLFPGDVSALACAERLFPQVAAVSGKKEIEHGLVHRIDTETAGLVLIAASQPFFDFLLAAQTEGRFKKRYRARVERVPGISGLLEGFPPFEPLIGSGAVRVRSRFRPFGRGGREVRPVTERSGRAALKKCGATTYETEISYNAETGTAVCEIANGFRHQVRAHLALCGIPVRGDRLYNPRPAAGERLRFEAFRLEFPGRGKQFVFETQ